MTIAPAILSADPGTRLWPLSRKSCRQPLARRSGNGTLLRQSAQRLWGRDAGVSLAAPLVATNGDVRFVVAKRMAKVGSAPCPILIEPEGRDTAPAVLAAAMGTGQGDAGRQPAVAEGKPRQTAHGTDRGADRRLSGRG